MFSNFSNIQKSNNFILMKKVGILDGQTIQTLPVAKSLKELGYCVILFCETKNSYGYYTKYADKRYITPSTKKDRIQYHSTLLNILKNETIDVLIPMNDDSAHYLSLNKKELSNYSKFIIPDIDVFLKGYDKNQLMKVCIENKYPHPVTLDLSLNKTELLQNNFPFPALIKPNETSGARGFAIVNSYLELKAKLPHIENNYGSCHLQEYIPEGGKQYKVEIFIHKQELINASVIHKIRFYPEKGGSSCFNQTVERKDLIEICFNVLKSIKWEGFADFDLIEDPRDQICKIMEINPRLPACIKASFSSGINFIENIVNCSLDKQPQKYVYTPGAYLRYFGLDLLWFFQSKNRFKIKPSWFKGLFCSKQYLQDGSFKDLKPFIYGTIGGFMKQLDPRFRAAKKEMN
jgi:predicted ATP-grasp superfamily ATP-dependent carboligase